MQEIFEQSTLITLYNSFLYPYLNYCVCFCGNTFVTYLDPLDKLQKRAIRVITGSKKYASTDPLFKKLKLLKLNQIYIYGVQLFMLRYRYNALPNIFENLYEKNEAVHEHDTRNKHLYRTPFITLKMRKRTIRATVVVIYNHISQFVTLDGTIDNYISHFKSTVKNFLISNDISLNSIKSVSSS